MRTDSHAICFLVVFVVVVVFIVDQAGTRRNQSSFRLRKHARHRKSQLFLVALVLQLLAPVLLMASFLGIFYGTVHSVMTDVSGFTIHLVREGSTIPHR